MFKVENSFKLDSGGSLVIHKIPTKQFFCFSFLLLLE